jgi:hypothetical protein
VPVISAHAEAAQDHLAYPGDEAPRRRVAAWMADQAQLHGLPRELPVMAALVESSLTNLPGGDAASVGYFQMQTVYWLTGYPDYPHKPELQMKWFIDQALAVKAARPELARDPALWGEWVADIENPAVAFRDRYAERLDDARALLAPSGPGRASAMTGAQTPQRLSAEPAPPSVATGARSVLADAHQSGSDHDRVVDAMKAEAERIDTAHVRYQWGGGHAAKQPYGSPIMPLDCSGAVARVLGIEPRHSSALASWGAPGPGRRVTIYANSHHVLMEIDGRYWGTSGSNPGGGPGWIPRSQLGDAYLSAFATRHPPGL